MIMRARLPFLAAFLLERLGPVDEELIGDVVEEYQSGRSRLWVWYQVFVAISLNVARTLWGHRRRAAGGLVLAWLVGGSQEYWFARSIEWVSSHADLSGPAGFLFLSVGIGFSNLVVGYLIGRVCRPFGPQIAIAYVVSVVPFAVISAVYTAAGAPDALRGWVVLWTLGQLCIVGAAAIIGAIVATGLPHQRPLR